MKKFILDDEASSDSNIGVKQDELSVQENVGRIQRPWNEFGEAINEDYKDPIPNPIPIPIRATVPQLTPVQEPFTFKARWNNVRPEHYIGFALFLYATDVFLWVFYFRLKTIEIGLSVAFHNSISSIRVYF